MKLTEVRQISTTLGDEGFTKNLANEVLSKDDVLFETLGTLDELSAFLGLCYHQNRDEFVKTIQAAILAINAGIAFDPASLLKKPVSWEKFGPEDVSAIEKEEQRLLDLQPIEGRFTLLGSEDSATGAQYNVARTVCRRAERTLVRYLRQTGRTDLGIALKYINRLSDLLFIMTKNR